MPKRFTDTEKWRDPWFRKLPSLAKLVWLYLCDSCNHAGIWKVDKDLASFQIGEMIDWDSVETLLGERIDSHNPSYWFILKFVSFQYGTKLNKGDAVESAMEHIIELGFKESLERVIGHSIDPPGRAKAKAKAIAKAIKPLRIGGVGEKDGPPPGAFEKVWEKYPRKIGKYDAARHFKTQVMTIQDFLDIGNAIDCFLDKLRRDKTEEKYIPHGSTWFNNRWRDWINYQEEKNAPNGSPSLYSPSALVRAKREAEKIRKESSSGTILTGV